MTEIEAAYNQGVDDACRILEAAAKSIPKGHAVTITGLGELACELRQLIIEDPVAS